MTPERWKRTEELYHRALALPVSDRAAFLAEACRDDEALRREVESLLGEGSADGFLDEPAFAAAAHVLWEAPSVMTGRTLGGYHLQALLGAGGMGQVYRAHDSALHRDVAIKILPEAFTRDPDRLARFEGEARMLAAVNHPNICTIHGLENADGVRFLVLELVEGETLADRIAAAARKSGGAGLPLREAMSVARQIADALESAHERGIVHRDLKPANVTITPDGVAKVLDFGLAKPAGDRSSPGLTHAPVAPGAEAAAGLLLGTPAYMSPEQARGLPVDRRTDIWAFGCVVYEMLAGRGAFAGDTPSDCIAKILEHDPDWTALPGDTPGPVRRLLVRCLAKDPKKRLRDIGDARIEIDAIDDVPPGRDEQARLPAPARTRTALIRWTAVAALAGAVVVWEAWRPVGILDNPLANARFTRITDWEGTEGPAEISPDGRFVAFVADRDGEFDIWWTQVGTEHFTNLTEDIPTLGASSPYLRRFGFTGDGAEIWFSVATDPVLSRKVLVPLTGGPARPFLEAGDAAPAWSSDGARVVHLNNNEGRGDLLFVADRTGGDARKIDIRPSDPRDWSRNAERMHNHNPVWSPDDQWLYFVHGFMRQLNWTDEMDMWRVRPSGGSPERLTRQQAAVTFFAPLDARTFLYVAREKDGAGPWLWALDVATRAARRVTSGLEQYTSVAASRDGRRVVATATNLTANLWTVPILDRIAGDDDAEPYPVPTIRALAPRFGGRSMFYLSSRGTADGLWRFQDRQVLEIRKGIDGPLFDPPAVSRDGRGVAIVLSRQERRRLTIMSEDGTGSRGLAESIDVQGAADWSPDGAWVVVGGVDDAQGPGLFKIPVNGGTPVRLVAGQAVNPVWSPDGNLIVYSGAIVTGQLPILAVRPDGAPVDLPPLRVQQGGYRFLPDGTGLVYLHTSPAADFWLFDLARKTSRQLTRLSNRGNIQAFDIAPDGNHIVFDRLRENSDIVLIDLPERR